MIKETLFKQLQLIRKHKITTGAVAWNWKPFQYFNTFN